MSSATHSKLFLVVRAKGKFTTKDKTWSSELAWARIVYLADRDEFYFVKTFQQQAEGGGDPPWAHPHFSRKACNAILAYARSVANGERTRRDGVDGGLRLKGHRAAKCERCMHLGHSCFGK